MKKQYSGPWQEATSKLRQDHLVLECVLPIAELIGGLRSEIESFSAQLGLQIMRMVMEQEIVSRLGRHGSQSHYRHGQQPGCCRVWRAQGLAGTSADARGGWKRSRTEELQRLSAGW